MRTSYTIDNKKKALAIVSNYIAQGVKYPFVAAAKASNVDRKALSKWFKAREAINAATNNDSRKLHPGRPLKRPDIEQEVIEFVTEKRTMNLPVSANAIAAFVKSKPESGFNTFAQSREWVYRMMPRNNLSIRRKTHDASAVTEEQMGEIHLDFATCIRDLMEVHSLVPSRVINMDETGCYFDPACPTTIDFTGKRKHLLLK